MSRIAKPTHLRLECWICLRTTADKQVPKAASKLRQGLQDVLTTEQILASPVAYVYEVRPEILNPPVGGHVVSHLVNNRLYLTMGPGSLRIATLIASSYLPRASTRFMITKAGIEDAPE